MALLTREMFQTGNEPQPDDGLRFIPDGNAGIAATLDYMVKLTKQFRTDPAIRYLAEQIVSQIPSKNWYAEVEAVRDWVRRNIRYTLDVENIETVKSPIGLLESRFGDCDDMSLLAGTLLVAIGHPVRYVAVGGGNEGVFNHVYVETKIGNRWIGVETTENVELGWIPEPQVVRMERHV